MSTLIQRKKDKVQRIFDCYGYDISEENFIRQFQLAYPSDWKRIQQKWTSEEESTQPGKRHSMQHPDVYMHEMYRNWSQRYRREREKQYYRC